jgi:hypothetical protein
MDGVPDRPEERPLHEAAAEIRTDDARRVCWLRAGACRSHFGTVLCAVFLHEQEMMLRLREFAWKLFQPGLEIAHREGFWHCELSVKDASGAATFRYRRKDSFLVIIDPAYDNLDFELANLPANLPSLASRKKDELVAEWSARARAP